MRIRTIFIALVIVAISVVASPVFADRGGFDATYLEAVCFVDANIVNWNVSREMTVVVFFECEGYPDMTFWVEPVVVMMGSDLTKESGKNLPFSQASLELLIAEGSGGPKTPDVKYLVLITNYFRWGVVSQRGLEVIGDFYPEVPPQ